MNIAPPHSPKLWPHWLICLAMLLLIVVYNLVCHLYPEAIRSQIDEAQRVTIRSVLYGLAILCFPLTNLLRHIFLRLNQTMPGDTSPARRYFVTILIAQTMLASATLFGPLMFVLGDDYNTLYIYSVLGTLGIVLHRPKAAEYWSIVEALDNHQQ